MENQKHSSSRQQADSENITAEGGRGKTSRHKSSNYDVDSGSGDEYSKRESRYRGSGHSSQNTAKNDGQNSIRRSHEKSEREKYFSEGKRNLDVAENERERRRFHEASCHDGRESHHKRRNVSAKLSEEERAARLREMQVDAELHEEQRWKRLRKAEDDDARESTQASASGGRNFLDAAHKSIYGAEKGGSSTIEESVRRRTHYSQGRRSEAHERNAFRR